MRRDTAIPLTTKNAHPTPQNPLTSPHEIPLSGRAFAPPSVRPKREHTHGANVKTS